MKSVGYFNDINKEFVITNMRPQRPLINYLWNEQVVSSFDNLCSGTAIAGFGSLRRVFIDKENSRVVYIKDKQSGEIYSPTRNFDNLNFDKYNCHVGIGYQQITAEYKNLYAEFTAVVPSGGYNEMYNIKLKNNSNIQKTLSVYLYLRPVVNLTEHLAYGSGNWDENLQGLYYNYDYFQAPHKYNNFYLVCDKKPVAYDTCDANFVGVYGNYIKPCGILGEKLSNAGTSFEEHYAAAMQFDIVVLPNAECEFTFVAGVSQDVASAKIAANTLLNTGFSQILNTAIKNQTQMMDNFLVKSPNAHFNSLVNIWLKRQIDLGKSWGRVYGKGFRDVMQDIAGFVSFDKALAKDKILLCLKHQFYSGNTIRMFDPIFDYPYFDGASWIIATIAQYIKESGDVAILSEKVGYFDNDKVETVLKHMFKGINFLTSSRGERGLVLWGGGDWNDSINNAGLKMKGESVWLSIATVKAIKEFVELLKFIGQNDAHICNLIVQAQELEVAIKKYGFDQNAGYYIYGFTDSGQRVGAPESQGSKIFLNPQVWAVLAGIETGEQANKLMDVVESQLRCNFGYVLAKPSYIQGDDDIGRVTYFKPGLYENGSVYNHGVAFKIAADCILKRNEQAYLSVELISAYNPNNLHSGMEPYAYSNMFLGPENKFKSGRAPLSWITGTAGWMYRNMTEMMLGVKVNYTCVELSPCMPKDWDNISVEKVIRQNLVQINFIKTTQAPHITVNGNNISGNSVPYSLLTNGAKVICYFN